MYFFPPPHHIGLADSKAKTVGKYLGKGCCTVGGTLFGLSYETALGEPCVQLPPWLLDFFFFFFWYECLYTGHLLCVLLFANLVCIVIWKTGNLVNYESD